MHSCRQQRAYGLKPLRRHRVLVFPVLPRDDMNPVSFTTLLAKEGFEEVVTVSRQAYGFLDSHAHPFEAKGLVLRGELRICSAGAERVYRSGQVFHLRADEPHTERYGADGLEYLVGRK